MEFGVSFAWDVGIMEVILECHSKIVFDALLGLCTSPMIISNILAVVYHQLQDFGVAQVSHVRRQGNKATHILAKQAFCNMDRKKFTTN